MTGLLLGGAAVVAIAWVVLARLKRQAGARLAGNMSRPLVVESYAEVEAFLKENRLCPNCAARLSRLGEDHVTIDGKSCFVVMHECDKCEDHVRYVFDVGAVPN